MANIELLDQAVTALREAELSADVDLAKVRVPGYWVRLRSIEHDSLEWSADILGAEVIAVVKDRDPARVYADLVDAFNAVSTALGTPDDTARVVTVNHPEGGALPALAIPFQLL